MDYQLWWKWAALFILLCCYAFFASAETSLFSLSPLARLKLKSKHPKAGARIDQLLTRPQRLLTSLIIGNEGAVIISTILATSISLSLWGDRGKWMAMGIVAPALLLFGEIIPKSLALRYPEWWACKIGPAVVHGNAFADTFSHRPGKRQPRYHIFLGYHLQTKNPS